MPFKYNLPVPEIPVEALDEEGGMRLKRYVVAEGEWVQAGTVVAELESARAAVQVLANGTGVLRKQMVKPGSMLRAGDTLAVIEADGEALPYDRPHSVADFSLISGE
jgi:pyruvate/2-oxoglutarate dehydrogenase complex dihydrolipoamide acyltransferase (E2) component